MIKIAHLYYDLMNLYGESGNIKALCCELTNQGIKYQVDKLSVGDSIDFSKYDFIYMGSGTNNHLNFVWEDLKSYKAEIEEAVEKGKFFLLTGNALELFGQQIDGDKKIGLQIFDYCCHLQEKRIVSEVVATFPPIKDPVIGFQNRDGKMSDTKNTLFEVLQGTSFDAQNKMEGFYYKNVMCTYIIGPILARNPEFLKYIIKSLMAQKNKNFKFRKYNLKLEKKAYDAYIKNYDLLVNTKVH